MAVRRRRDIWDAVVIGALRSGYGGDLVSAAGEAALAVAAAAADLRI